MNIPFRHRILSIIAVISFGLPAPAQNILAIAAPLASPSAAAPGGFLLRQYARVEAVRSIQDLQLSVYGEHLNPQDMLKAHWEIRTADNARRVADVAMPWHVGQGNAEGIVSSAADTFPFNKNQVRSFASLRSGSYVAAWIVGNVRASNVIHFTIDAHPELTEGPLLRILQLEPMQAGGLPYPIVYLSRIKESDPAPNQMLAGMAQILVDGSAGTGPIVFQGPGYMYALPVGGTFVVATGWQGFQTPPDLGQPHTLTARLSNMESPPVALQTQTPLADAWTKGFFTIGSTPQVKITLDGTFTASNGLAAANYEVVLTAPDKSTFIESVDSTGRFEFRNISAGDYSLTCSPQGKRTPAFTIKKVTIGKPHDLFNFAFVAVARVSGKLTHPDGSPAAHIAVTGNWTSADASLSYEDVALTDDAGRYTLSSPLPQVANVSVAAAGSEPASFHDITAPRNDLDFKLDK